jgi:hypothetical protein
MIMLPWTVAADSFGRHVADQFIAFQVVVRNLNPRDEFLMHSVNIAVADQRFYSGVDKVVALNTQNHGQAYDERNFWIRALEVAGDIAAGAAPYASGDTQAGIAVFRAAFIPGMGKIFPDRYASQIQAMNDLAFSSATAYKIVVPVKGSAPFVTFLPADIFSQRISSSQTKGQAGTAGGKKPSKKDWHYKYWNPTDLHEFAEHTYVIAAGIHVTESHNEQPTLDSIDCGGASGTIDLTKPDPGGNTVTCTMTGTNFDKVAIIRLKNAIETTDTLTADGIPTITGGQTTSAKVVFQVKDLSALKGTKYSVYLVTAATKAELPTKQTLTIAASPAPK